MLHQLCDSRVLGQTFRELEATSQAKIAGPALFSAAYVAGLVSAPSAAFPEPWCLRQDLEPPCDPTVQVKVERDFGAIVDADGTTHLDKGTVLSMSREEAEPLIRQGVLSLWHQEGYRI